MKSQKAKRLLKEGIDLSSSTTTEKEEEDLPQKYLPMKYKHEHPLSDHQYERHTQHHKVLSFSCDLTYISS